MNNNIRILLKKLLKETGKFLFKYLKLVKTKILSLVKKAFLPTYNKYIEKHVKFVEKIFNKSKNLINYKIVKYSLDFVEKLSKQNAEIRNMLLENNTVKEELDKKEKSIIFSLNDEEYEDCLLFIETLNELNDTLKHRSKKAGALNDEVSKEISTMNTNITEESKEIKEILTNVGNVFSNLEEVFSVADLVNQLFINMIHEVKLGDKTIGDLIEETNIIESNINEVLNSSNQLVVKNEFIQKAVTIIDSISKETKLLSFNASIEAARAGVYGAGFGVISKEIKILSDKVSENSKNIREIINENNKLIQQLNVKAIQNTKQMKTTRNIVDKTSKTFNKISEGVQNIKTRYNQVLSSTDDNKNYVNSIIEYVENVSEKATNNASCSEKISRLSINQTSSIVEFVSLVHQNVDMLTELSNVLGYNEESE